MGDRPVAGAAVPRLPIWLFLGAGVLATVFAANTYLSTFTGTFYEPIQGLVGPAGFLLAAVGLLTLYPRLADRTPGAHLPALLGGLTVLTWLLVIAGGIAEAVGIVSEQPEFVLMVSLGAIVGMVLSFGITGLLTAWVADPSRVVGGLMLLEAAMFLLVIARLVPAYLIDTGHVLAFFGIAVMLWYQSRSTDRSTPIAESTP